MKQKLILILVATALIFNGIAAWSCTNYIITKGASADGSVMITYSADSHVLYGELYFRPAMDYPDTAMLDIYEWDTYKYLGKIKQVKHTYSVVGNMNEHQLAIGETTFGGKEELESQPGAIMDYGSLIYIALQRAKTAREAIKIMGELVAEYGYASHGESFSISDPNEAWIMELVGKGKYEKGAVWVAIRIPDGYVSGHANQARITTFPLNDPQNCIYSADVISFARKIKWYDGADKDFDFAKIYAPVSPSGARACDSRVWAMFRRITDGMDKYLEYIKGDVTKERLPLYVKPKQKLSVHDVMELMRDHFEGTFFDMNNDIGAGPFHCPYRWRPMDFVMDSVTYVNERATSTQQTGFSFVTQSRSNLPNPIGGILWFGVDDTYSTVYAPMYCGIKKVPEAFAVGNGDMITFSWNSAFWVFNLVSNWAYTKYNVIIKEVRTKQAELEGKYIAYTPAVDAAAMELHKTNPELARDFLTDYSVNTGNALVKTWKEFAEYLIVRYKDGNEMKAKDGKFIRNEYGQPPFPAQPGYPKWWLKLIKDQHGNVIKSY